MQICDLTANAQLKRDFLFYYMEWRSGELCKLQEAYEDRVAEADGAVADPPKPVLKRDRRAIIRMVEQAFAKFNAAEVAKPLVQQDIRSGRPSSVGSRYDSVQAAPGRAGEQSGLRGSHAEASAQQHRGPAAGQLDGAAAVVRQQALSVRHALQASMYVCVYVCVCTCGRCRDCLLNAESDVLHIAIHFQCDY